jgi:hypothetical protein
MHEQAVDFVNDVTHSAENQSLNLHLRETRPDLQNHLAAAQSIERQCRLHDGVGGVVRCASSWRIGIVIGYLIGHARTGALQETTRRAKLTAFLRDQSTRFSLWRRNHSAINRFYAHEWYLIPPQRNPADQSVQIRNNRDVGRKQ